jgi:DNA-binding NarL/FixJ family response regulator
MRRLTGELEPPAIVSVVLGRFDSVVGLGLAALMRSDNRVRVLARDVDGLSLELALARWAPCVMILASTTELGVLEHLRSVAPDTRLLVLGYELSSATGMRILGAGANCVALGAPDVDVPAAVHETARGERFFAAREGWRVERNCVAGARQLTVREREVLALLVEGATYQQVGHALGMSARTAEKHAGSIFRKLGVRRKRELEGMPSRLPEVTC